MKALCTYQCYARGGGRPRDRVGTLIRNKNLESNFLTLGIRFQFKVPHLGEGFEFNISLETENFKPSDREVKNRFLHLTRLSMTMLLQWKAAGRSGLFIKNLHSNKASKTSFNLTFTQLMTSQTQNITAYYMYSWVNVYNQFQLRMFKFVFILQVIVGPLMHQSIPVVPIPARATAGHLLTFSQSRGWALAYPRANPGHLTHVFSKDNISDNISAKLNF